MYIKHLCLTFCSRPESSCQGILRHFTATPRLASVLAILAMISNIFAKVLYEVRHGMNGAATLRWILQHLHSKMVLAHIGAFPNKCTKNTLFNTILLQNGASTYPCISKQMH
jgi:hypothetical protein